MREFAQNYDFIDAVKDESIDFVCYLKAFDQHYARFMDKIDSSKPFIVASQSNTLDANLHYPVSIIASLMAIDLKRRGHQVDLFTFNGEEKVNVKYYILLNDKLPVSHYPTDTALLQITLDEHLMNAIDASFMTARFWNVWSSLANIMKVPAYLFIPWVVLMNAANGLDALGTMACSGYLRAIQRMQRFLSEEVFVEERIKEEKEIEEEEEE